jgi:hypothetical protein
MVLTAVRAGGLLTVGMLVGFGVWMRRRERRHAPTVVARESQA